MDSINVVIDDAISKKSVDEGGEALSFKKNDDDNNFSQSDDARRQSLENVDTSPYNDRLTPITKILDTLGDDHKVSSTGTFIGTAKFGLEKKTLTLIMFSNMYPLSNTSFINLGRAQFLCDQIKGAQIDICAHILQTMGKMAGRLARRMCLPFCNLAMKIMTLKGVYPLKEGTTLPCQRPISLLSLFK